MKSRMIVLSMFLMVAVILPLSSISIAFASHPTPLKYPFNNSNQSICYQTTSLDRVKINGQTDRSSLIKAEVEKARNHISRNTDMTISYDPVCNSRDNTVRGKYFNSIWLHATTLAHNIGSNNQYKWINFTTNQWHNFIDSGSCNWWESENIKYVANHEFGHFAGLGHAPNSDSDSHTMMKSDCTPGYATIKPADKKQINGLY